jgi:hypothetical protein
MTRIVFNWPDEAGEAVRAARGRLEVAGVALAQRPFEERLGAVSDVVESWSTPDSPWRRELAMRLASSSALHPRTLEEGLDSALRAWDPDEFRTCARREIAGTNDSSRLELAPYRCTSVIAGGSIPMPTLLSGLLPLVLGSPVLLRETTKDAVTGRLLARSITERDPALGECFEVVRFAVEDDAAMEVFLESPCVVATGSDATISSIRERLAAHQRFVAYGHRFSIAILGPMTTASETSLQQTLTGLALDIARWDQGGCLSPIDVYLVGLSSTQSQRIARGIADALAELSTQMPRGDHSTRSLAAFSQESLEARMRAAVSDDAAFFDGTDFAVALESDARPRPAPLARLIHLLPVSTDVELERILLPLAPHLSTAAVAGFSDSSSEQILDLIRRMGMSRVCAPGSQQRPPIDWPHDGMPVFLPMAKFVQWK